MARGMEAGKGEKVGGLPRADEGLEDPEPYCCTSTQSLITKPCGIMVCCQQKNWLNFGIDRIQSEWERQPFSISVTMY